MVHDYNFLNHGWMDENFDATSNILRLHSEIWMSVFALNSNAWEFLKWMYSKAFTSRPIPFHTWIYAHLLFKLVGKLFAHNEWRSMYHLSVCLWNFKDGRSFLGFWPKIRILNGNHFILSKSAKRWFFFHLRISI